MIQISEKAAKQIRNILTETENKDKQLLRIKVEKGGCSGLSYKLDFDSQINNDDEVYTHNEIQLVVDKKSLLYLAGTTLDYEGGLNGKGFIFLNPMARKTCHCGESFAV